MHIGRELDSVACLSCAGGPIQKSLPHLLRWTVYNGYDGPIRHGSTADSYLPVPIRR